MERFTRKSSYYEKFLLLTPQQQASAASFKIWSNKLKLKYPLPGAYFEAQRISSKLTAP